MTRQFIGGFVLVGAGLGLSQLMEPTRLVSNAAVGFSAQTAAPAVQRWEYRVERVTEASIAGKLNELGADGWEVVAVARRCCRMCS